jgi:hypothetical protein
MAGLNAPWNDARNQMFESLGQAGSLGSAGAGMSGAAGAALGEFESNRANQMGLQAWNMMQPGLDEPMAGPARSEPISNGYGKRCRPSKSTAQTIRTN